MYNNNILTERIFNKKNCNTLQDLEDEDNEIRKFSILITTYLKSKIEELEINKIDNSKLIFVSEDFISKNQKINLNDYLVKIFKLTEITQANLITGLCYLDNFFISNKNIKKLILLSLMISTKFYEDYFHNNEHWAFLGGIDIKILNNLEKTYLMNVNYKLIISEEKFNSKVLELSKLVLL